MAFAHWQRYLFLEALPPAEQAELFNPALLAAASVPAAAATPPPAATAAANKAGSAAGHRRLNVVWLSRTWFGRNMGAGGGLNSWQQQRQVPHETESQVVRALEQAVLDWNSRACAPPVFGWWQMPHDVPAQAGCTPTNVTFDFRVRPKLPTKLIACPLARLLLAAEGRARLAAPLLISS